MGAGLELPGEAVPTLNFKVCSSGLLIPLFLSNLLFDYHVDFGECMAGDSPTANR
jgi:hypothetical protein